MCIIIIVFGSRICLDASPVVYSTIINHDNEEDYNGDADRPKDNNKSPIKMINATYK